MPTGNQSIEHIGRAFEEAARANIQAERDARQLAPLL